MDGDPQLTHFSGGSNMKDGEIQKDKWQKTGQSCKATIYVQETKGITKVQIGSVYKRADGTFYLELQEGLLCRIFVKQEGLESANLFLWIQKKER